MAAYQRGTADPTFPQETGSGRWRSQDATNDMVALRLAILAALPHATVMIGPDAAMHMYHYLENSGRPYAIRFANMIREVASTRELHRLELAQAKTFVEGLPPGMHLITSSRSTEGYVMRAESRNWSYAVGGYSVWGKGTARVRETGDHHREYQLDFEFKFGDRYDWHEGNVVNMGGVEITDDMMGRFHRQGLAREYEMTGSVTSMETWGAAVAVLRAQSTDVRAVR